MIVTVDASKDPVKRSPAAAIAEPVDFFRQKSIKVYICFP